MVLYIKLSRLNKSRKYIVLLTLILAFAACKPSLTTPALTGKWKYMKVEHPNANPPDTMKKSELDEVIPYIQFTPEMKWVIVWGGRYLSHGTYTLDGSNMKMHEVLADGKTRDFVFTVSEFTESKIVFETIGEDGSKVTALKAE